MRAVLGAPPAVQAASQHPLSLGAQDTAAWGYEPPGPLPAGVGSHLGPLGAEMFSLTTGSPTGKVLHKLLSEPRTASQPPWALVAWLLSQEHLVGPWVLPYSAVLSGERGAGVTHCKATPLDVDPGQPL